eukprot:TRINITY_DN1077_c0_g2_i1.p1 TRINITY_DN1077_c0_g2~~TRINITY_DN1077_c0_g2_i1.p1  ORF type:complete len:924 (+),score=116.27 TRINITY_DN1077_c0_g2_i1:150-2921(+)
MIKVTTIFVLTILSNLVLESNAQTNATIIYSGNWSNSTIWKGGIIGNGTDVDIIINITNRLANVIYEISITEPVYFQSITLDSFSALKILAPVVAHSIRSSGTSSSISVYAPINPYNSTSTLVTNTELNLNYTSINIPIINGGTMNAYNSTTYISDLTFVYPILNPRLNMFSNITIPFLRTNGSGGIVNGRNYALEITQNITITGLYLDSVILSFTQNATANFLSLNSIKSSIIIDENAHLNWTSSSVTFTIANLENRGTIYTSSITPYNAVFINLGTIYGTLNINRILPQVMGRIVGAISISISSLVDYNIMDDMSEITDFTIFGSYILNIRTPLINARSLNIRGNGTIYASNDVSINSKVTIDPFLSSKCYIVSNQSNSNMTITMKFNNQLVLKNTITVINTTLITNNLTTTLALSFVGINLYNSKYINNGTLNSYNGTINSTDSLSSFINYGNLVLRYYYLSGFQTNQLINYGNIYITKYIYVTKSSFFSCGNSILTFEAISVDDHGYMLFDDPGVINIDGVIQVNYLYSFFNVTNTTTLTIMRSLPKSITGYPTISGSVGALDVRVSNEAMNSTQYICWEFTYGTADVADGSLLPWCTYPVPQSICPSSIPIPTPFTLPPTEIPRPSPTPTPTPTSLTPTPTPTPTPNPTPTPTPAPTPTPTPSLSPTPTPTPILPPSSMMNSKCDSLPSSYTSIIQCILSGNEYTVYIKSATTIVMDASLDASVIDVLLSYPLYISDSSTLIVKSSINGVEINSPISTSPFLVMFNRSVTVTGNSTLKVDISSSMLASLKVSDIVVDSTSKLVIDHIENMFGVNTLSAIESYGLVTLNGNTQIMLNYNNQNITSVKAIVSLVNPIIVHLPAVLLTNNLTTTTTSLCSIFTPNIVTNQNSISLYSTSISTNNLLCRLVSGNIPTCVITL